MLKRGEDIIGRTLRATDGEIGKVHDLYFDDERWTVRYLVAATGGWLRGRDVLISPASLDVLQESTDEVPAKLTRKQVEGSPGVETDKPVSRQYEASLAEHFGYSCYWMGPHLWGPGAIPIAGAATAIRAPATQHSVTRKIEAGELGDSHLRSCTEVNGYRIDATDGSIGHVVDFLIDPESWEIRQMLIDTRDWLPGKHVVVAPRSIRRVDWPSHAVALDISRADIKERPDYRDRA